ncbi:hypothetical protein CGT68_17835 [Vibrio cholerae]|uniref:hypothetical protein n=1 Tax=Vibrio cholerae TaxID=666 RepID=UPI000BA9C6D7|nr:hypothetical protein [Vibrio cholerae]PAS39884.1 hypothetical protein CGT68_17835 [Vibrio cholerae]PAS40339.1 hypothetical protein CGT69_14765 [Vibrio cholerae]
MLHIKFITRNKNEPHPKQHFVSCLEYTLIQNDTNEFTVKAASGVFSLKVKALRDDRDVLKDLIFTLHIDGKLVKADVISYIIRDSSDTNYKAKAKVTDSFMSALSDWIRV